jgi:DNA-binding transcriptional regulator GbsR (MarR family)
MEDTKDTFTATPDCVNILVWMILNKKFKEIDHTKSYIIFVTVVTMIIQAAASFMVIFETAFFGVALGYFDI